MPLDNSQIKELRRLLEARRKKLSSAAKRKKSSKKTKKRTKKGKSTSKTALAEELKEVEAAIERMDDTNGRYGYCERCFMEIPWRDLAVEPARRWCSRCS